MRIYDEDTRRRIARVIVRLGDANPNEVIAAASALVRLLEGVGSDLIGFARFVESSVPPGAKLWERMIAEIQARTWAFKGPEVDQFLTLKESFDKSGTLTAEQIELLNLMHVSALKRIAA